MNSSEREYTISEMAEIHEISRQTLIYYHKIGLFLPHRTDPVTGYRFYTLEQCPLLREIRLLVQLHIPLGEIKDYLHSRDLPRMKELLTRGREETRQRLRELRETEKILTLRLNNLGESEIYAETAPTEIQFHERPRRYYTFLPYPGRPNIEDSSLLFRRMIGRFKGMMQISLFREFYHELKLKHGQLMIPPGAEGTLAGCGAAVYAEEKVVTALKRKLKRKGLSLPGMALKTLPPGRYARLVWKGALEKGEEGAALMEESLRCRGLTPRGPFLFTAVLEPPFILNRKGQLYGIEVLTESYEEEPSSSSR